MRDAIGYSLTDIGREMVERNINLAYKLYNKYRKPYVQSCDEWLAECMDCLCLAVALHDASKGTLSTLLDRLVRLRRQNINDYNRRLKRAYTRTFSLDAVRCGETGARLEYELGRESPQFDEVDTQDLAGHVAGHLKGVGRQIVEMFAAGKTLREIGDELGFSRQYAHNTLMLQREKLAEEFPEYLSGSSDQCQTCGGPVILGSKMNKPKFCPKCSRLSRDRAKRKYMERKNGGLTNAR